MFTDIIARILIIVLASPIVLIAFKNSRVSHSRWLILLSGLFILDIIWFNLPVYFLKDSQFPWQPTIIAALWDLFFIYFLSRIPADEFGLTTQFKAGTKKPFLLLTAGWSVVLFLIFYYFFDHRSLTGEGLIYNLTMPGISEELIYHGILLTMLNRVFISKREILKAKIGWGILIVAILYALVNAIRLKDIHDFSMTFNTTFFIFAFCSSLLFGYVKERTGNLVASMASHNLWNTIVAIAQAIN